MPDTKITNIIVKHKSRAEMSKLPDMILRDRELMVETEGEGETFVARFKIGDGHTNYANLPYVSNLYKVFPNFVLYNNDYTFGLSINLKDNSKE